MTTYEHLEAISQTAEEIVNEDDIEKILIKSGAIIGYINCLVSSEILSEKEAIKRAQIITVMTNGRMEELGFDFRYKVKRIEGSVEIV